MPIHPFALERYFAEHEFSAELGGAGMLAASMSGSSNHTERCSEQ